MKTPSFQEMPGLARQTLERCLQQIPFAQLEETTLSPNGEQGMDILAQLRLPAGEKRLVVEVKTSGEPRRTRDAINQLYRYQREWDKNAYPVFIAPYLSPQAAALCEEEGVGYLDLAGNCRLAFDTVYIRQEGRPNPYAENRPLRSLYSPKAERVLRVLMTHPGRFWKMEALASEAEVSLGQVAKVKTLLADREWIWVGEEGLLLSDPQALLAEWKENYRYRRSDIREFYCLQSVAEIENTLSRVGKETGLRYALTGFSGAERLAPFVRYQKAAAYIDTSEQLEILADRLKLKPVTSGANVSLIVPYDAGVFYNAEENQGKNVVSPVQCYLDVQSLAGRGEEAAEAILREVLQPQWKGLS
jgi:hypothetical protein